MAFNNTTSFATPGVLQADTSLQAAERAGKKVVAMEWVGGPRARARAARARSRLPDVHLRPRRSLLNYDLPGQPALANSFSVAATSAQTLADATGWTNVPDVVQPGQGES